MIGANHVTLEQRPERFDIVGMGVAARVFAASVMDGVCSA